MTGSLPTPQAVASPDNEEFFAGLERGELVLPRCDACATVIWYPRHHCPACGGARISWFQASGEGTIYSFTIVHKGIGEWASFVPYVLAYVELAEGPRVLTNIVTDSPSVLRIGDRVRTAIEPTSQGPPVLRFRPV